MTHRQLCKTAASWLLKQRSIDLVTWELKYIGGVYDVVGLSTSPTTQQLRLCAIEVKRTRSDLLKDLRTRKILKYQKRATHCYLAATPEALLLHKLTAKETIKDLQSRGLPKHWGVLCFINNEVKVLKAPQRNKTIRNITVQKLTRKIARSYMYRILSDTSPMKEL